MAQQIIEVSLVGGMLFCSAGIDIGGGWRGDREVPLFLTSVERSSPFPLANHPLWQVPRHPLPLREGSWCREGRT